jgi:hypothetical protein
VTPLTQLTRKDQYFSWGVEDDNVFESLKASFTTIPLLIHLDISKPFVLETDAFDLGIGVMLSQLGKYNLFHPIGFHSRKFFLAKINYEIHDKTHLPIVDAFEEWHHLFEGVQHEIIVYLDHKNLKYFMTTHVSNQHQTWWALSLSGFQFVITYHLGF